ncbi:MAG: porphobilinogen synthase [Bacteriovoracaceae bacterium]|nr:porphobilinogen synthase [Bacteriovoracaceae bacterium]
MLIRPRRTRTNQAIRSLVSESRVTVDDLIQPLFVMEGKSVKTPIKSMPGQYRFSLDYLLEEIQTLKNLGIKAISLFPVIDEKFKTTDAREAYNPNGLNQRAVKAIKDRFPEMLVMTDIALDPYNRDGHDGLVDAKSGKILNDQTLEVLNQMALVQAQAGSDILGPSDMMDGRVLSLRQTLESNSFQDVMIMSYSAKYASAFYGPFREALDSAPKSGDKKTYQMDFSNAREAVREALLDQEEGADILMVKPGLSYLDVVYQCKQASHLPIAVYNVSGEYAMVMAAAEKGWVDADKIMLETLTAFKRAGADIILTYFAKAMAERLHRL